MMTSELENVLKLIKEYDITFNASISKNVNNDTANMLVELFKYIENIYSPSDTYKKYSKEARIIREELEDTMTEKQKNLLDRYNEKYLDSISEEIDQAFIYGFCLANQLRDESIRIYNLDKKQ